MVNSRCNAAVLSGALLIASSAYAACDFLLEIDGVDGAASGAALRGHTKSGHVTLMK